MFLSSPNCRIHAVIRHIAPYYVQSCRIMFYSKFEILWPYVEAGIFAPASTYGQLFFTRPYKNRSPFPITSPRFALLYRTSSPHIAVLKALPWQMKSTLIVVLFLLVLPRNAIPRLSSRSRQSQNARLCKHIGMLRSLLRVFCKGFQGYDDMLWKCRLWQTRADLSMLLLPVSSKIGSKTNFLTTKNYTLNRFFSSSFPHFAMWR